MTSSFVTSDELPVSTGEYNQQTSEALSPSPLCNKAYSFWKLFCVAMYNFKAAQHKLVAEMGEINFVKAIHHRGHRKFLHLAKRNLLEELQCTVSLKATLVNSLK
jgi:hypothetical protein